MAKEKQTCERDSRREAVFVMAVVFATVAIWKGFSGLIDLLIAGGNNPMAYIGCIVIGLGILGATHYGIRQLIK